MKSLVTFFILVCGLLAQATALRTWSADNLIVIGGVTAGGVLVTDGSKITNIGAGTSGQFLKSNGASAPTWSAAASNGFTNPVAFTTVYTDVNSNTLTKGSTIVTDRGTWWQSGHFMNIQLDLYWTGTGSGASGDILLTVPNASSIDLTSTGMVAYTGAYLGSGWTRGRCGSGWGDVNGGQYEVFAQVYDATHIRILFASGGYYFSSGQWNGSNPVGWSLQIQLPIVGF
jgi:hypothetical protein